ncbi:MAG: hypothetical protein GY754_18650 [bacterium]|nr:hypothetical protein [bacterium]
MLKKYTVVTIFISALISSVFLSPLPAQGTGPEPVIIDAEFSKKLIAWQMEYIEDAGKKMELNDVREDSAQWTKPDLSKLKDKKKFTFNFGFTTSVYWFRFSIENKLEEVKPWYFEITYPMLDSIKMYVPHGTGGFSTKEAGDLLPYKRRDVKSRTFIFSLKEKPGLHTYYMRIETSSSINFKVIMWEVDNYLENLFSELPLHWIYFGLMIIMVLYNFFIFISVRDISYILYTLFIATWIFLQLTLNGFAFQYLWPQSIWWANNCLPLFMILVAFWSGLFFRSYMQTSNKYKILDIIILLITVIPVFANLVVIFGIRIYALSIKVATIYSLLLSIFLLIVSLILSIRGSRPARFYLLAFLGLLIGIICFILKTWAVLPSNTLTNWSIQIGSSLTVVLLSLGLADKINTMRKDMEVMNIGLEKNEKQSKERAEYLEGIVKTTHSISDELIRVSDELGEISAQFGGLAGEQGATSEEMSATFEQLTASNETIYRSTVDQKDEGEKTRILVHTLTETQQEIIKASAAVIESIEVISDSTNITEFTLRSMINKMGVISDGGKAIENFIAMIDDITDRINLLSLNASIEAARAGEHGRGFAVVAEEIGKLATATADNSKEISSQISNMTGDIIEGMNMVENTKNSIDVTFKMVKSINTRLDKVKALMGSHGNAIKEAAEQANITEALSKVIENSTKEQSISMDETLTTIERLSEMAQEISVANQKIGEFVKLINQEAIELDDLVKKEVISDQ